MFIDWNTQFYKDVKSHQIDIQAQCNHNHMQQIFFL